MHLHLKHILLLCWPFLLLSCQTYNTTNYKQTPGYITKTIEGNYQFDNAFFYQIDETSNDYLFWYYENATVHWYKKAGRKTLDKGTFRNTKIEETWSVYQTNLTLLTALESFEFYSSCRYVLDGAKFGYLVNIDGKETFAISYIYTSGCLMETQNNLIGQDFKKILDLNNF